MDYEARKAIRSNFGELVLTLQVRTKAQFFISRAVGVGSYPVSPEKLRMCVQIGSGNVKQDIYIYS